MNSHEAFADGRLAEALTLQETIVRNEPHDSTARLFLVELLTFAGRLREARDQLRTITSADPGWPAWQAFFLNLLKAEWRRSAQGRRPTVLAGTIPLHAKRRWSIIRALRNGDDENAAKWLDRAEAASPELAGFVDGREFVGLRDADDRFASILEAFADGEYLWLPWEAVRRIKLNLAKHPRDGFVRAAEVKLRDGTEILLHLPMIYPGSCKDDDALALGLGTDYTGSPRGPVRCLGSKLLLFGEEEITLGECSMIEVR